MKKICFTLFVFMILGSCSMLQGPMEYNENNNQVIIIDETDTEAPKTNGSLTIEKVEGTIYLKISWQKAKDNITAQNNLRYKLIRHTDTMIIDDAEEIGELIMDWTENALSYEDKDKDTKLEPNKTYFYALLVMDQVGNKSLYSVESFTTSGWKYAGQRGFSSGEAQYISLALSSDDTPYVAYKDVATSKITVKKYNGSSWINVGSAGFSDGEADCISLIVIGSTPYVSFVDKGAGSKLSVMKYNGSNWEYVGGQGFSESEVWHSKIATNGTDLYVAFIDESMNDHLSVMKYNSNDDKWQYVGNRAFSSGEIGFDGNIDIKVSSNNGTPFVAYANASKDHKITVEKFNDSSWQVVGEEGFSKGRVNGLSLVLDSSRNPIVVYKDFDCSYKAVAKRYQSPNWENLGSAEGFSLTDVDYPVIALYNNTPYVAYHTAAGGSDLGKPTVLRYNGSSWDVYGYKDYHSNMRKMSLAISSTGKVYTAFQDVDEGWKVSVMYFD